MSRSISLLQHLFLWLVIASWSACAEINNDPNKPLNVLFIGNSLTYGNSMPVMFEKLVNGDQAAKKMHVEAVTIGGATLQRHWYEGRALAAIQKGGWDYVVIQEYSTLGRTLVNGATRVSNPANFQAFASLFNAEIKKTGAKTLLLLTWSDKDKSPDQVELNKAFVDAANALDARIIPAGPVWHNVRREIPELELYQQDQLHPTAAGSYVTACVLYAHLLGEGIIGKSGTLVATAIDTSGALKHEKPTVLADVSASHVRSIQKLAVQSVGDMPEFIREMANYRTSDYEAPAVTKGRENLDGIEGKWSGELMYYRNLPAKLTMTIYLEDGKLVSDQTVLLSNGDKIQTSRTLIQRQDGSILWMDAISDSYFAGVYTGDTITGTVRSAAAAYREPGGRFGSWMLEKQ